MRQSPSSLPAEGFSVKLDGKQVKTPAGKPVVLPTQAAAALVAAEFAAQEKRSIR